MISVIQRLWHELALNHGPTWVEWPAQKSRKHGVVVTCDCGKRWLSRAPWDLNGARP
ncbi:hypothetical protein SEA_GARDANN_127 [Mycobacterium phage Gardann]|uniref:hypothetical protein n=1 Tax=Mycobacterium phage Gardann TaxID=1873696 RepID=UPI00081118CD|nr:hypothetical protein BI025_gp069 [Mycobacterium phage Gardann]ANU79234.1 hypothetical protein SEA_GARDANN_127 [Mycobacterium phage Gardann]ASR87500.1 hypothetical protein SEA_NICHOLASP3_128 [Mycobacterium phage Nicholasp3]QGZ16626.1 hypothetical protein PBI_GABRIELA_127 [Mycobacterium phage Gabriela]